MKREDLCPGMSLGFVSLMPAEHLYPAQPEFSGARRTEHVPLGIKRRKVKCPICGRRVTVSVRTTDIQEFVEVIPPHKPHRWWKKQKK